MIGSKGTLNDDDDDEDNGQQGEVDGQVHDVMGGHTMTMSGRSSGRLH